METKEQKRKNERENINAKGITLIALVVTIIVLIILAGVSIAMVVGDNGIITQAQRASKETANITIASEEQMNALVDEVNKHITGNGETGDTENTIPISELKTGAYIKYDTGLEGVGVITCRVLYPADSEYGLQIISDKNIKNVTLGATTFEEGRISYNNAIETLNNETEEYINPNYALDARCVGSVPTIENEIFSKKDEGTGSTLILPPDTWNDYTRPNGWTSDDTHCYDTDENYVIDQKQMQNFNLWTTGEFYWLASRIVAYDSEYCGFNIRYVYNDGNLYANYLCSMTYYGDTDGVLREYGLRPCFLLREDIKVIGGDGKTEETAYTISV